MADVVTIPERERIADIADKRIRKIWQENGWRLADRPRVTKGVVSEVLRALDEIRATPTEADR